MSDHPDKLELKFGNLRAVASSKFAIVVLAVAVVVVFLAIPFGVISLPGFAG